MAKMTLYTRKDRYKGLREMLDEVIRKQNQEYRENNKENHPIKTRKRKLSPAVREILLENPIVYKRR